MRWLFPFDAIDSMVNPVMQRDLCRSMQNRTVAMMLMAYSLGCVMLAFSSVLLPESFLRFMFAQDTWTLLIWLGYAVCSFGLPTYYAIAAARDKLCKANLFRMTFMSPFNVVLGQLMASVIVAAIFIIFLLPFGLFCFFGGGLDISTMAGQIGILFVVTCINLLIAFSFASLGRSWLMTFQAVVFALCVMAIMAVGGALYGKGIYEFVIRPATFEEMMLVAIVLIGFGGLLYLAAGSALSVSDGNRALPVRCYLTGLIACWGLLAWYVSEIRFDPRPLLTWLEASWFILAVLCVFIACERSEPTPRIRRAVPKTRLLRIPCYCFYSGSSNGFFWCFSLGFALAYLWAIFYKKIPGWTNMLTDFDIALELYYMFYLAMFSFCMSITVVLIRYVIFHDKYPRLWNCVIIIALATAMHYIVGYYADKYCASGRINNLYSYTWLACSPQRLAWIMRQSKSFLLLQQPLVIYGIWAGFVTILLFPWHLHQMKLFKPLHDKPKFK